jgi:hypothetical protein
MSRQDWFRSSVWNPQIEEGFYAKLGRATKKKRPQYLCLQAYHLRQSHSLIALRLLAEYFALGDHLDDSRAHTFRADAHLTLGNIEQALEAYESALAREKQFPHAVTDARVELPFLIASRGIRSKYRRALTLLADPGTLLFPIQRFRHHASFALILADSNESDMARSHAVAALREAQTGNSGLRYHPELGLVADTDDQVRLRLSQIAGISEW